MEDGTRVLRKRLDDKSYPLSSRLVLCEKIYLCQRLENLAKKEQVVLEWLSSALMAQPSLKLEKKVLKVVQVLLKLLKVSTNVQLPDGFAMVLSKWLMHVSTSENVRLSEAVCQLWRQVIENGIALQYFEQHLIEFFYFLSILVEIQVKISSNCQNIQFFETYTTIFNWALGTAMTIKRSSMTFANIFEHSEKLFRPSLNTLLRARIGNNDSLVKIRNAIGALLLPKDFEIKVKEVIANMFNPDAKRSTFFSTLITILEKLVVSGMLKDEFAANLCFFEIILEKCRNLKGDLKFYLFVIAIRILGVDVTSDKYASFNPEINARNVLYIYANTEFNDTEASIQSLWCLLEAGKYNFSLVMTEDSFIISPSYFFQNLLRYLLSTVKTRCSSWYKCVQVLLHIHCNIVFPNLEKVLNVALDTSLDDNVDIKKERVNLLCDLIDTYGRLRRISKFFEILTSTLSAGDVNFSGRSFPRKCSKTFGEVIESMTVKSSFGLWAQIINGISKVTNHNSVGILIELLNCVISNIRILHLNSLLSADDLKQLVDLSYETSTDCIANLLDKAYKDDLVDTLECSLRLAESWGDLHMCLIYFKPMYKEEWQKRHNHDFTKSDDRDLSLLHFYIKPSMWKKIWKLGNRTKLTSSITYFYNRLLLQKLKMIMLFGDSSFKSQSLMSGTELFVDFNKSNMMDYIEVDEWNEEMLEFDDKNMFAANWLSLCSSFPLIVPQLNVSLANSVGDLLVTALAMGERNRSLLMWSQKLLESTEFNECKSMQSAVITNICKYLLTSLEKNDESKRSLDDTHKINKLIATLFAKPDIWIENVDSSPDGPDGLNSVWKAAKKSSLLLNKAMTEVIDGELVPCFESQMDALVGKLVKIMQLMPLEYLLPCNQVRCLLANFGVILLITSQQSFTSEMVNVIRDALMNIICIFDGFRYVRIFEFVDASILCNWMFHSLYPYIYKLERENSVATEICEKLKSYCKILLENMMSFFKRSSSKMEALAPFISHVTFSANDYVTFSNSVMLLRLFQPKASKSKLRDKEFAKESVYDVQCRQYRLRLTESFTSFFSSCVETELLEEMTNDENILSCLLEGLTYVDYQNDSLNAKLVEVVYNLACRVAKTTHHVDCLRHSCRILIHPSLQGLQGFSDSFQNGWLSFTRLFEVESSVEIESTNDGIFTSLINNCNIEQFSWILQNLSEEMSLSNGDKKLDVAVGLWKRLCSKSLESEKAVLLEHHSQMILVNCSNVIEGLASGARHFNIISHILDLEAALFRSLKLTQKSLSVCLHGCIRCDLEVVSGTPFYFKLAGSMFNLINEILENQSEFILRDVMAAFLRVVQYLLKSVIRNCNQDRLLQASQTQFNEVANVAQSLQRLLTRISNYESQFSRVSLYIVSYYIDEASTLTLHPSLKPVLLEGIYAVMNNLQQHDVAEVMAALNQSGREVFGVLYETYKKYYSYKGKV